MSEYRPRWRSDADGFVKRFAGKWAADKTWADREALEEIVRQCPNSQHLEIVEVAA